MLLVLERVREVRADVGDKGAQVLARVVEAVAEAVQVFGQRRAAHEAVVVVGKQVAADADGLGGEHVAVGVVLAEGGDGGVGADDFVGGEDQERGKGGVAYNVRGFRDGKVDGEDRGWAGESVAGRG